MVSSMKRTTLVLQDRMIPELRRVAADRGQTIAALVDEFLADGLRRANAAKQRAPSLPVFDKGEPLVDIKDPNRLFHAMR